MTKTLELVFRNEGGKQVTIRLADPREDLTEAEVQAVMNEIIAKNVFITKDGDFSQIVGARIQSRDTVELF